MKEKEMLAELTKNCTENRELLLDLLEQYDIAVLGRQVEDAHEKEISNRVLAENEFFADKDADLFGMQPGERITNEEFTFVLSESEHKRFLNIRHPLLVEAKICDENGYYLTNWTSIKVNTMNALVDFIIAKILPTGLREIFSPVRRNVIQEEKLIGIVRKAFAA